VRRRVLSHKRLRAAGLGVRCGAERVAGVTAGGRRIYVASSWRCERQPRVVAALRAAGHQVYDFRHPDSGGPPGEPGSTRAKGFAWSEIDPDWQGWDAATFTGLLMTHQTAA
jgi:hypothetical protein